MKCGIIFIAAIAAAVMGGEAFIPQMAIADALTEELAKDAAQRAQAAKARADAEAKAKAEYNAPFTIPPHDNSGYDAVNMVNNSAVLEEYNYRKFQCARSLIFSIIQPWFKVNPDKPLNLKQVLDAPNLSSSLQQNCNTAFRLWARNHKFPDNIMREAIRNAMDSSGLTAVPTYKVYWQ